MNGIYLVLNYDGTVDRGFICVSRRNLETFDDAEMPAILERARFLLGRDREIPVFEARRVETWEDEEKAPAHHPQNHNQRTK